MRLCSTSIRTFAKAAFKDILRLVCWMVLFLGIYSVSVLYFNAAGNAIITQGSMDKINAYMYILVSKNLLLLAFSILFAGALLLKLKGASRDTEYYLAMATSIVVIIAYLIHAATQSFF